MVIFVILSLVAVSGRIQEGISDLDLIKDKRDVNVCSLLALSYAHRMCKTIGNATI